ncbi:MAG: GGDEF domain-containing protein [Pseudomonadales bacterium]
MVVLGSETPASQQQEDNYRPGTVQSLAGAYDGHNQGTDSLDRTQKLKKQALLRAFSGFMLLVLIAIPFVYNQAIPMSWAQWSLALFVTLGLWGSLYLLAHLGLDSSFSFDPNFLIIPAMGSGLLLCLYEYLVPDLRVLVLAGWFTVLLFGVGITSLFQAVMLSLFMGVAHLMTIQLLILEGEPLSLEHEFWVSVPLMVFWGYSALVLERTKKHRDDNKTMRKQLSEMAYTDSLTGLPNRRLFYRELEREAAFCERSGGCYVVAMLDLDDFKVINDQLGHDTGDQVLVEIATIIVECIRTEDIAARIGGDEFLILLRDENMQQSKIVVERICSNIEQRMKAFPAMAGLPLTMSAGLAIGQKGSSHTDIMRRADIAMYESKHLGRNQVFA